MKPLRISVPLVLLAVSLVAGVVPPGASAVNVDGTGMLRVTTSPSVASQISIDGEVADTWGLNWLQISPGSHQVCFSDVPGYTTPNCSTVTVGAGTTTTVNGAFTKLGYLKVVTSPPVNSRISVDGIARNNWGLFTTFPAGSHQVCFGAVAGKTTPPCQTVNVTAGATATVTGTFAAGSEVTPTGMGMLRVTTSPSVASQITVDNKVADDWGLNWLQVTPGTHQVCFSDVEGYRTPNCQNVTVTAGTTTEVTGVFVRLGYLRVTTAPPVASQISVDGVPRNNWGLYTTFPAGSHTVCFGDVPSMPTPLCQTATVIAGATADVIGSPPATAATAVVAGDMHSCALRVDRTIACWGNNDSGQLGNAATSGPMIPPTPVTGITDAAAISAGALSSCALHTNGTVSCWGYNFFGQLGNGTLDTSKTPVAVSGLSDVAAISQGHSHVCALRATGSVVCWGKGDNGQLGNGTLADATTPVAVSGITDATAITAGGEHTCVLRSSGTVSCWGFNYSGQLGNGTTTDSAIPVTVTSVSDATAIEAGASHVCAVRGTGTMSCWGNNFYGQLGNGGTVDSPTPVTVTAMTDAADLALGMGSTCVIRKNRSVACWGYNFYGQLGNGGTVNSSTPVSVPTITDAVGISTGKYFACAVKATGSVACWGRNTVGQLGDGTTVNRSSPVTVVGIP